MVRRKPAKVEHHLGELFPRVGFIVRNMTLPSRSVGAGEVLPRNPLRSPERRNRATFDDQSSSESERLPCPC